MIDGFSGSRIVPLAIAFALVSAISAHGQTTWTGAGDTVNWSTAANWSDAAVPDTNDDLVVDAAFGTYLDGGSDGDVDLQVGAPLTVNSVKITGDFSAANGVSPTNTDRTHSLLKDETSTGPITIDGADGSGDSLHYESPLSPGTSVASRGHDVRLNLAVVFAAGTNPTIRRSGNTEKSKRFVFNRDVTAAGQTVTLTNNSIDSSDAIQFSNGVSTTWAATVIAEGAVRTDGGTGGSQNRTLGGDGTTVTTASTGNTSLNANPGNGGVHNNNNDFVLGTAGWTELRASGSTGDNGSTETFNITGELTGGDAGVDLILDADNGEALVFTSTSNIDVQSQIRVAETSQANSRVTLSGTVSMAAGGVSIADDADRTVDGTGTIVFEVAAATTLGAQNYGGMAWDVQGNLDISGMTADFTSSEVLTEGAYVLIDYSAGNGNLIGTFANEVAVPNGYAIDYDYLGGDQLALVQMPEPGLLSLVALSGLIFLRRRRS